MCICFFSKWYVCLYFQEKAKKSWLEQSAESVELVMDDYDSEEEKVNNIKQKKATSVQLNKLQQVASFCF